MCEAEAEETVVVMSRAEHAAPSRLALPPPPEREGLLRADGTINWACPCLGGMAAGPCGEVFRDAFSCFHYSAADPKGSDCYDKFSDMQRCMADYPALYGDDPALPSEGGAGEEEEEGEASTADANHAASPAPGSDH